MPLRGYYYDIIENEGSHLDNSVNFFNAKNQHIICVKTFLFKKSQKS